MVATRENALLGLLSFTVVVIAKGYDAYSLLLVLELLSLVVSCNICHTCSNVCIILCKDVAY